MAPARSNTANVSWCMRTRARSSWPSETRFSGSAMGGESRPPAGVVDLAVRAHEPLVYLEVLLRHAGHRESPLEFLAAGPPIEPGDGTEHTDGLVDRGDDRPGDSRRDH